MRRRITGPRERRLFRDSKRVSERGKNYKSNSFNNSGLIASTPVLIPQPLHAVGFSHGASSAIRGGEAECRRSLPGAASHAWSLLLDPPQERLNITGADFEQWREKKKLHSIKYQNDFNEKFFIHM